MAQMTPVSSSNIAAVGYDEATQELFIEFNTGVTYGYSHVPEEIYQGILDAASPGSFFHDAVRNSYRARRV